MIRKIAMLLVFGSLLGGGCTQDSSSDANVAGTPASPTSDSISRAPRSGGGAPPPPPTLVSSAPSVSRSADENDQPTVTDSQANGSESPPRNADSGYGREVADVGAGKQGRKYGGGVITEPIRSYFRTRDRIELKIKLPQAMRHFKAIHDRFPESQEEFDREILQASQINLPELPEGERYVYDPKTGELMVERPAS